MVISPLDEKDDANCPVQNSNDLYDALKWLGFLDSDKIYIKIYIITNILLVKHFFFQSNAYWHYADLRNPILTVNENLMELT